MGAVAAALGRPFDGSLHDMLHAGWLAVVLLAVRLVAERLALPRLRRALKARATPGTDVPAAAGGLFDQAYTALAMAMLVGAPSGWESLGGRGSLRGLGWHGAALEHHSGHWPPAASTPVCPSTMPPPPCIVSPLQVGWGWGIMLRDMPDCTPWNNSGCMVGWPNHPQSQVGRGGLRRGRARAWGQRDMGPDPAASKQYATPQ